MDTLLKPTKYGHLHLGCWFKPVVVVDEDGLTFKGRRYAWSDIDRLDDVPPGAFFAFGYPLGRPVATIVFRNGATLRINGMVFVERNRRPRLGFWSATSDAYDEFVAMVRRRIGDRG